MKHLVCTVIYLFAAWACNAQRANERPFFLIAHRGGVVDSLRAENSLPAIDEAIRKGYAMVELDMRLTADSVLIIQHDRTFKRYFGVDSPVTAMTWQQVSRLRSHTGSHVPALEEALQRCSGRLQVMLDNKITGNDTLLFARVIALLEKYHLREQALMIGTDASTPYFTGKIKLSCTRQQLEQNRSLPGYDPRHYYLFGNVESLSSADIQWAKQQGIMVVAAVNLYSYRGRPDAVTQAKKDIATLKARGVTRFQIDSELGEGF